MKAILQRNSTRKGLRIFLACMLGLSINSYYDFANTPLMLFSIFFVMVVPRGKAFNYGLWRLFLLMLVMMAALFINPGWFEVARYDNAVLFGGLLGFAVNAFVFSDQINPEFQEAAISLLQAFADYFSAIITLLLTKNPTQCESKRVIVEDRLQKLPFWIYTFGFEHRLQKGHRYYFMKLQQVAELLFAMHYVARCSQDDVLLNETSQSWQQCVTGVNGFIAAMIVLLSLEKLKEGVIDFAEDIDAIENKFKETVAVPLAVLNHDSVYLHFAEMLADLRDLRATLVQLAKAVR